MKKKNIAKHLIGKTRFTVLKLPRSGSVIIGNGSADPVPYQNKTDPKHCLEGKILKLIIPTIYRFSVSNINKTSFYHTILR